MTNPYLRYILFLSRRASTGSVTSEAKFATIPHPWATAALAASPAPQPGSSFSSPPHYSCHVKPWQSATWPMINAAGCGAKSSLSGGAVVRIRGRALRRCPEPGGPPCVEVAKGAAPGSGVRGGGGGAGFAARLLPPLCLAEYASVTAGWTPGVTDQDLRQSEAWLGNRRRLAGVIRALVASPLP